MDPVTPVLPSQLHTYTRETVIAKDQPQYRDLPAIITPAGRVVTCWRLDWWERLSVLWSGRLWLQQLTHHRALQPQLPTVREPVIDVEEVS